MQRLKIGDTAPDFVFPAVYGANIELGQFKDQPVLLAFHRYASCPICNLSLKNFERRYAEIRAAGFSYLPVFHSKAEKMKEYYPVAPPFPLLVDPEMHSYRLFGVENSLLKTFSISSGIDLLKSVVGGSRQSFSPDNQMSTIPADFFIYKGKIRQLKYGSSVGDSWTVDEALQLAKTVFI
jgi:thioredoxin-dependent peroxiredoxin